MVRVAGKVPPCSDEPEGNYAKGRQQGLKVIDRHVVGVKLHIQDWRWPRKS